jgi:hypothetical protein
MPDDPLSRAGKLLSAAEYRSLEERVKAHDEALKLMYQALRALQTELSRSHRKLPGYGGL